MTVEQMRKTKKPIINDDRLHTATSELRVMAYNHKTNVSLYINILER
jgi:hypothetical protein